MKNTITHLKLVIICLAGLSFTACGQTKGADSKVTASGNEASEIQIPTSNQEQSANWNELSSEETYVIVNKGTERPWTGKYVSNKKEGIYVCKRCDYPLFTSDSKFESGTGWPSFDAMIADHVKTVTDADGMRTEIVCGNCEGHLGHVFMGEGFTDKNTRHCVNSVSLNFLPQADLEVEKEATPELDTAIFASGCFWGTEYYFEQAPGVVSTQVGYIGGTKDNPTYKEVCTGKTGHAEAVRVVFDKNKTDFETMAKLFFETHDPTQVNRQGPDIGTQYRTGLFYKDDSQKAIAEKLKKELEAKGLKVVTEITKATTFWEGEDYHEHYYSKKGGTPYCHKYTKRF
jgi:peptide methionine sulfoxide reductase msrA/msrB